MPFWIAELRCSHATATKIAGLHHLQLDQVRDAVVCQSGLPARRHVDPVRGLRFLIDVVIGGMPVLVVVYPTKRVDVYNLASAYPLQ
jgi:hypothetical protein